MAADDCLNLAAVFMTQPWCVWFFCISLRVQRWVCAWKLHAFPSALSWHTSVCKVNFSSSAQCSSCKTIYHCRSINDQVNTHTHTPMLTLCIWLFSLCRSPVTLCTMWSAIWWRQLTEFWFPSLLKNHMKRNCVCTEPVIVTLYLFFCNNYSTTNISYGLFFNSLYFFW